MMEFIAFLSTKDKEILDLLYKAKFSVEENTPLCLLGEKFFGFLKKEQKIVVICTKNAMKIGGYRLPKVGHGNDYDPTKLYIRRALRHEAVHVAQNCKKGTILSKKELDKINLHPYKQEALKGSTRISRERNKEFEAYWMEDRPNLVRNALKKYCI